MARSIVGGNLRSRDDARCPTRGWQGRLRDLALDGLAWVFTERIRQRMRDALPAGAVRLVMDLPSAEMLRLAQLYVGPATSGLIVLAVAKLADFLRRGAAGAISAAGVNCMLGSMVAMAIPAIHTEHGGPPVISPSCGARESPADRMRLETFVLQVKARRRQAVA